jgi:amidophosphoribosyltransferase
MLLDIQNRGQLSTGMTTWRPGRDLLLETYKELGGVSEAFRLNHRGKAEALAARYAGRAAIGHVRYATCGRDDLNFAQPFEHRHLQKRKWFAFGFNGQLANYGALGAEILAADEHHVALASDTEILMHELARQRAGERQPTLIEVMRGVGERLDGAYSIALLNAHGEMLVARDPLGMKPVAWGLQDNLFAAASESVALLNLGFEQENIHALEPGEAVTIVGGKLRVEPWAPAPRKAHCFFEWVYFANVASVLDGRSVYLARKALGEELAAQEQLTIDADTVVVPVPDTSKAAADAMAYKLGVPCVEGLMRNRYSGRTFIEGGDARLAKVTSKYTPLREVLEGKRILLVEDSIVRSTTMRALIGRLRDVGRVREIHVRVACPPIVAPCFYGIDMSTVGELFAPPFLSGGQEPSSAYDAMARELGADSLRYLPVESIARAIQKPPGDLCRACVTGDYPTAEGQRLYQVALEQVASGSPERRTYEGAGV